MCACPVAYENAVPAPFTFKDIVNKIFVVAAVLTLVKVVSAHKGVRSRVCRRLKGRKIYLTEGSVRYLYINARTVKLLIVKGKMLDTGCGVGVLNTLYRVYDHFGNMTGVLTHIFEVSAADRGADDVDARS